MNINPSSFEKIPDLNAISKYDLSELATKLNEEIGSLKYIKEQLGADKSTYKRRHLGHRIIDLFRAKQTPANKTYSDKDQQNQITKKLAHTYALLTQLDRRISEGEKLVAKEERAQKRGKSLSKEEIEEIEQYKSQKNNLSNQRNELKDIKKSLNELEEMYRGTKMKAKAKRMAGLWSNSSISKRIKKIINTNNLLPNDDNIEESTRSDFITNQNTAAVPPPASIQQPFQSRFHAEKENVKRKISECENNKYMSDEETMKKNEISPKNYIEYATAALFECAVHEVVPGLYLGGGNYELKKKYPYQDGEHTKIENFQKIANLSLNRPTIPYPAHQYFLNAHGLEDNLTYFEVRSSAPAEEIALLPQELKQKKDAVGVSFLKDNQEKVQKAIQKMYEKISKGESIFVFCQQGKDRSAFMVAAFILSTIYKDEAGAPGSDDRKKAVHRVINYLHNIRLAVSAGTNYSELLHDLVLPDVEEAARLQTAPQSKQKTANEALLTAITSDRTDWTAATAALDAGADVNLKTSNGMPLLMVALSTDKKALSKEKQQALQTFIEKALNNPDVDLHMESPVFGNHIILEVIQSHDMEAFNAVFEKVKQNGTLNVLFTQPNSRSIDNTNTTPLELAIKEGQLEMAKVLAPYYTAEDLNHKTGSGNTALVLAATMRANDLIPILIEKGADRTLKSKGGLTPYECYAYDEKPGTFNRSVEYILGDTIHQQTELLFFWAGDKDPEGNLKREDIKEDVLKQLGSGISNRKAFDGIDHYAEAFVPEQDRKRRLEEKGYYAYNDGLQYKLVYGTTEQNITIDFPPGDFSDALFCGSLQMNDWKGAKEAIEQGADPNIKISDEPAFSATSYPLLHALSSNVGDSQERRALIETLLNDPDIDLNVTDDINGSHALLHALHSSDTELAPLVLDKIEEKKLTALCTQSNSVNKKESPNSSEPLNENPLEVALLTGRKEVAERLLNYYSKVLVNRQRTKTERGDQIIIGSNSACIAIYLRWEPFIKKFIYNQDNPISEENQITFKSSDAVWQLYCREAIEQKIPDKGESVRSELQKYSSGSVIREELGDIETTKKVAEKLGIPDSLKNKIRGG